jgi:type I restriction enzyme, S subunit
MIYAAEKPLHVPVAYGEPPEGWVWSRLDDICEGVFDCPHSTPKLTDAGPFVVRTQDIITAVFRADQAGRVSEETYAERIARVTPSRGDLLYSREGTYFGIAAEVPTNTRICLGQRMVLIRPDKHRLDFRFLRHWLNSPVMAAHIHGYRDGTVAERLNLPTIRALPVLVPPLAEQKAIAAVLGALDNKIELNGRMNATLEAMVRALFQSWFVDFDPVRLRLSYDGQVLPTKDNPTGLPAEVLAKAGLDPATAALFASEFEDSELGPIPKGWSVTTVGAKLSPLLGGTPSRARPEYWINGTVAWINSGKTNEFRIIEPSEWITKDALENSATKLLPRRTTVLAITGATLGQVSLTEIECCANQSVVAVPASDEFPTEFIYPWIEENIHELLASQTGGAQQHVNKGNVEELSLLQPEPKVMNAYLQKAKPLFDQIATNCFQSSTLAALRDVLLPKLLNGQLRVAVATTAAA